MISEKMTQLQNLSPKHKISLYICIILVVAFLIFWLLPEKYDTVLVERGNFVESVFGLATIQSSNVYHLRIAVPSIIVKIFVEKGDFVRSGEDLVRFDSFGNLKSPIKGVVTNFNYEQGELVSPQSPILTVTDLDRKYLSVFLEERSAVKVRRDQKVRLRFEALGDLVFIGKVESVYPSEGQFEVKIGMEKFPAELLPGMTADVAIEVKIRDNALLIPIKAVQNGEVTIVNGSKLIKKKIQVGMKNSSKMEVFSSDLKEGDRILLPSVM